MIFRIHENALEIHNLLILVEICDIFLYGFI
jgi:hypothetical protein